MTWLGSVIRGFTEALLPFLKKLFSSPDTSENVLPASSALRQHVGNKILKHNKLITASKKEA